MTGEFTGTIRQQNFAGDVWTLVSESGKSYELLEGTDRDLLVENQRVKISGKIRKDILSLAMAGPILEVISFEILS